MNPGELPLRDIHLPEPVSWWPPAVGWYLLLLLIALSVLIFWLWKKWRQRFALRKTALHELQEIRLEFEAQKDARQLVNKLSSLLRRVCLSRFPREQVAGLQGKAWTDFLNSTHPSFNPQLSQALTTAPYAKEFQLDEKALLEACENWLQNLPLKKRGEP